MTVAGSGADVFGPGHPEWCPVGKPENDEANMHCGHWYECEPCHRCGDDTIDPTCDCDRCTSYREGRGHWEARCAPFFAHLAKGTLDDAKRYAEAECPHDHTYTWKVLG